MKMNVPIKLVYSAGGEVVKSRHKDILLDKEQELSVTQLVASFFEEKLGEVSYES